MIETRIAALTALLEASPRPIWLATPDGRVIFSNANWRALTGRQDLGFDFTEVLHPEDRALALHFREEAWVLGVPCEGEYRMLDQHGIPHWFLVHQVPDLAPDGTPISWVCSCVDIHDFKTTLLALENEQQATRALLELSRRLERTHNPEDVIAATVDCLGRLLAISWLGLHTIDGNGRIHTVARIGQVPPVLLAEIRQRGLQADPAVIERLRRGEASYYQTEHSPSGLFTGLLQVAVLPIPGQGELSLSALRNSADSWSISERAIFENAVLSVGAALGRATATAELARARLDAERANQAKSDYLATMSHELRTPLSAINGFAELLLDGAFGDLNDSQSDYVGEIANAGTHLLALINDVLDLAKIEADRMELELQPLDLAALLKACQRLVRGKATERGVELTLETPMILPIMADALKLKQVIVNLASNAVKFTAKGGQVTLSAHIVRGEHLKLRAGFWAEIAVTDTGIGMSQESIGKLFQAFAQVDDSRTRRHEGTGLGLALSKKLVDLHGGEIRVESELGQGSVFRVYLPMDV
jgi:PAS domain S-box-containing protein